MLFSGGDFVIIEINLQKKAKPSNSLNVHKRYIILKQPSIIIKMQKSIGEYFFCDIIGTYIFCDDERNGSRYEKSADHTYSR